MKRLGWSSNYFHLHFLNIETWFIFLNSSWKKVWWRWRFELACAVPAWHLVQPPPSSADPAHPTPTPVGEHLSPQGLKILKVAGGPVQVQKTASSWRSHLIKVSWLDDLTVLLGFFFCHTKKREWELERTLLFVCEYWFYFFRAWRWPGDWRLLSDPGEFCSWHLHP